jgi:hypothetical protein
MNKMLKILETVWFIIGIIALSLCAYSLIAGDTHQAVYFLVMAAISAIMFMVRRRQRRNFEKASQPPAEKKA